MELSKLIIGNRCRVLRSTTKTEALLELLDVVADEGAVEDIEGLKREIFYREQIMSTGIGQGIGIPHVRFHGIPEPIILVGTSPSGLADYESLDGETVRLIFMILVDEDQHKEYLRILSLLVQRLKDAEFRNLLAGAETDEAVCAALKGSAE